MFMYKAAYFSALVSWKMWQVLFSDVHINTILEMGHLSHNGCKIMYALLECFKFCEVILNMHGTC